MKRDQITEAQTIFESSLSEADTARMGPCFVDLTALHEKYGDTLRDCMLYLCGKIEMEAEERAEQALPVYVLDEMGGNA